MKKLASFGLILVACACSGCSTTNQQTDWQWYNPMSMVRSASNVANQQFATQADIQRQRIATDRRNFTPVAGE